MVSRRAGNNGCGFEGMYLDSTSACPYQEYRGNQSGPERRECGNAARKPAIFGIPAVRPDRVTSRLLRGLLGGEQRTLRNLPAERQETSLIVMSPRSLVFSSSEETSRQLGQALHEMELQVESCPEIFAALKSLTSRTFDVIVVDWDEGLEAGFLLKTARELKSNQAAFTIAIGRADAGIAVRETGADLVLTKPIFSGQVRYALLTSDKFLARMPAWLPQAQMLREQPPTSPEQHSNPATPAHPRAFASPFPSQPASVTFATLEGGLFQNLRRRFQANRPLRRHSQPAIPHRPNSFLSRAAVVVAFFAVGYVFSQPLSKVGASAAQIYRGAWGRTPSSQSDPQANSEWAQADSSPLPRSHRSSSARIRVLPVRDGQVVREKPATEPAGPVQTTAQVNQEQIAPAAKEIHIPESLQAPFPGVTTVRNAAAKLKPALLDALEPVSVPEYLSEKLLLEKIEPSYPEQALRAGLQGPVVLQAWIGTDGRIRDLKLIRGSLLLGQAACQAVKQWRYKPYLLNGEAVDAQTYVTVDFKLP